MRALVLIGVLAACGSKSDAPADPPAKKTWPVALPQVNDVGLAPHDDEDPAAIVSTTGVTIDGQSIVPIKNGAFDDADVEGGKYGRKVIKLAAFTKALLDARAQKGLTDTRISLLFDRTLTYRTLLSTMYSMKTSGAKRFAVVALTGDDPVAVPITLPDKQAPRTAEGRRDPGADLAAQIAAVKDDAAKVRVGPGSRVKVVSKTTTPSATTTPEIIAIKIQTTYRLMLERCAGKAPGKQTLKIAFTIDQSGTAVQPKVTGAPAAVVDCIGGSVGGWRFPIPKHLSGGTPLEIAVELGVEIEPPPPEDKVDPDATNTIALRGETIEPDGLMMNPDMMPLQLVVSVTKDEVRLWSISKMEGTLHTPRWRSGMTSTVARDLGTELSHIIKRRWTGKERPPESRQIIFMADAATPMQTVAMLMFAMRMQPDRTLLFPEILLASGFE